MSETIDLSIQENIDKQLESILRKVFESYRNRTARKHFLEVTPDLKPKSCTVKTGWVEGKWIAFECIFEKNGDSDIFKEIVKGMKNKEQDLFFLFGLKPEIFHFNKDFIVNETNEFYCRFKLMRTDEKNKRKKEVRKILNI